MSRVKPILFNTDTDMVRAILDGRKTVTRRLAKKIPVETHRIEINSNAETFKGVEWKKFECHWGGYQPDTGSFVDGMCVVKPPCQPGDILYVRETWGKGYEDGTYIYKADDKLAELPTFKESTKMIYKPSIHMPKEAARIWLRVTAVRVERLQDITEEQAMEEGAIDNRGFINSPENEYQDIHFAREHFKKIWDSTIKKSDLDRYGWDANPWVWVIEFERCDRPKGWPG